FGLLAVMALTGCDSGTAQPTATATVNTPPTTESVSPTAMPQQGQGTPSAGQVNYPGGSANLTAAGSTFINPLMSKWGKEYNQLYPGVKINYQSIGSGGGKTQFTNKTVDFGATDSPLSDDQYAKVGGADKAMHIPMVMGGVVLTYNLKDVTTQLKLDGPTLAGIYLQK